MKKLVCTHRFNYLAFIFIIIPKHITNKTYFGLVSYFH